MTALPVVVVLVLAVGIGVSAAVPPDPGLSNDLVLIGNGGLGGVNGTGNIKVVDVNSLAVVNTIYENSTSDPLDGLANNHGVLVDSTGRYLYNSNNSLANGMTRVTKFDLGTMSQVDAFDGASADVYALTSGACGLEWNLNDPTSGVIWVTSMSTGVTNGGLYELDTTTGFTGRFVDNTAGVDNGATCGIGWNTGGSVAYAAAMTAKKTTEVTNLSSGTPALGNSAVSATVLHMLDVAKADNIAYVAAGKNAANDGYIDIIDLTTMTVVNHLMTGNPSQPHDVKVTGNGFLYAHSRFGGTGGTTGNSGILLVYDIGGVSGGTGTKTAPVLVGTILDEGTAGVSCGTQLLTKSDYCGTPSLNTTKTAAYWASPADQAARLLSVDYNVSNAGSIHVNTVNVSGAANSNGVTTNTALPATVGNIAATESGSVTVKYLIPGGITSFTSNMNISSKDLCNTATVLTSGAITVDVPAAKNYYFTWYDSDPAWGMNGDWITIVNKDGSASASVNVYVGDISDGATPVATFSSIAAGGHVEWMSPTPLTNGAVRVASVNGQELAVSQRALYKGSFSEVKAVEYTQLDDEYHMPWYDNTAEWGMMGDWICVTNLGSATANVEVHIGGSLVTTMTIPAGGHSEWNSPTPLNSGPVKVASTNAQPLLVSQRVIYKETFNEVMGIPASKLAAEAWFTWYDNNSEWGMNGDWIIIANTGASAANVEITVGGTLVDTLAIPAGGHTEWTSPVTLTNGPVKVKDTNGQPLVVGRRALFMDSFDEIQGTYTGSIATTAAFNWYDNNAAWGMREDWICVTNTSATEANVEIYIGGVQKTVLTIPAGGHAEWFSPDLLTSGPVRLLATGGQNILVSQRVLYRSSFNELVGDRWS
ncbi:MAG: hypothetical protein HZB44_04850 [Actinobacteria bacterium]|nr:hypothetical protein [Actinomycetota bacterium]